MLSYRPVNNWSMLSMRLVLLQVPSSGPVALICGDLVEMFFVALMAWLRMFQAHHSLVLYTFGKNGNHFSLENALALPKQDKQLLHYNFPGLDLHVVESLLLKNKVLG